jgi:hypothetical protein
LRSGSFTSADAFDLHDPSMGKKISAELRYFRQIVAERAGAGAGGILGVGFRDPADKRSRRL